MGINLKWKAGETLFLCFRNFSGYSVFYCYLNHGFSVISLPILVREP